VAAAHAVTGALLGSVELPRSRSAPRWRSAAGIAAFLCASILSKVMWTNRAGDYQGTLMPKPDLRWLAGRVAVIHPDHCGEYFLWEIPIWLCVGLSGWSETLQALFLGDQYHDRSLPYTPLTFLSELINSYTAFTAMA
jgi:hypothetical protein